MFTGCTCGVIGIGAQHASTCPYFHRSAGDSDGPLRGEVARLCRERDEAIIAIGRLLAEWRRDDTERGWTRRWDEAMAEAERIAAKYPRLCPLAATKGEEDGR